MTAARSFIRLGAIIAMLIGLGVPSGAAWGGADSGIGDPMLFVSPASGVLPFTVKIITNRYKDPGGREYIDYGDGTREMARGPADPHESHKFIHTYRAPGVYKITFWQYYIYDRRDPTYANRLEIFRRPGSIIDPTNSNQVLVPHRLGSKVVIVR